MFQTLVFPRKNFPTIFNCFGGQKCKLSNEIKIPGDSIIYCLFVIWDFWPHGMYNWKHVFTKDFVVRIPTFSNLS